MKGLKIDRATPSNAIDIHALLTEAANEKVFSVENPNKRQLQQYYFQKLIPQELTNPMHFWYLARRGRGFLGVLHAFAIPGRWDGAISSLFVDLVFVVENRRSLGVGKELIKRLCQDAEDIGIKTFDFLAEDKVADKWIKEFSAKKISNLMRVEK